MLLLGVHLKNLFSKTHTADTVYALSTGLNSAISIVRISGPDSFKVLKLIEPSSKILNQKEEALLFYNIKPRQMALKSLFGNKKQLIDRCLMVYFESSKSYSGEDLFELHLHGSKAIASAVFNELTKMDFKPAKRGQFTRRAFLNGRMNLLEAEAVNDLIQSQLEFERQIAVNNLMGRGSLYLESLRKDLIGIKMLIESYIQFEEQQVGLGLYEKAKNSSKIILKQLQEVIQSSKSLQKFKEGVRISIVGRPNVGKSTLINKLVKKSVAIVSQIPGTTRDLIESSFDINGYKIDIVDTAGIRQSSCQIEIQGIKRSKISMKESQILLFVIDISQSNTQQTENSLIIQPHLDELVILRSAKTIVIINKMDVLPPNKRDKQILVKGENGVVISPSICISANNDEEILKLTGILSATIQQKFNLYGKNGCEIYFTRDRYIKALQDCSKQLQLLLQQSYPDIGSYLIDNAIRSVEEIIGKVDNEEVLDQIFSTFCIGK